MSAVQIRPASIESIKRLAKAIRREHGIVHTQALELAAKQAGFQNFQHAKNTLQVDRGASVTPPDPCSQVYVTAYWRELDTGHAGRETMRCVLSRPLTEVAGDGHFYRFRVDADDHLERVDDAIGQQHAQTQVLQAIRWLQFADATGLLPCRKGLAQIARWSRDLPEMDHASVWADPVSGAAVFADEPYRDADLLLPRRQAWAADNGAVVAAPEWDGMYLPPASTLFLAALEVDAALLAQVVARLAAAVPPTIEWRGDSMPYAPVFTSPGRLASGKRKRARPRPRYAQEARIDEGRDHGR